MRPHSPQNQFLKNILWNHGFTSIVRKFCLILDRRSSYQLRILTAVGAPRPQWQELSAELMNNSTVYVDSFLSATKESGDVIKSGAKIYAEIGEVILGNKKAETNKKTIFKSLGNWIKHVVNFSTYPAFNVFVQFVCKNRTSPWRCCFCSPCFWRNGGK